MHIRDLIQNNLKESREILDVFISHPGNIDRIEEAVKIMSACIRENGKILSCGNGGSMCDAIHFAEELSGRFRDDRQPLPAMAISDPAHITCVGNDLGFEHIFSRYVEALGNKGDALLAISTSGNSENVILAAAAARAAGMKVIGLTGKDGGKLAGLCDVEIRVSAKGYADRIQEVHIKIIHSLIHGIEMLLA